MSRTFKSVGVRNFRLFITGQLVSQVGNWLTLVAQVLLVLELTDDSGVALGLLTACQFAPVLLLGPWAGLHADRSDKRHLVMFLQTAAMFQSFALAGVAFLDQPPVWPIFALAACSGVVTAYDGPARRSFVTELVPEDHMQNAVSLNSTIMTAARVFGPAVASLLINTVGFGWCFLLDGVSYLAVLCGLWRMDISLIRTAVAAPRGPGQIKAGFRYVRERPELRAALVMMTILGALSYNFNVVFPLFIKQSLGETTLAFGLFFSVVSMGSVLGGLIAARRATITLRHVALAAMLFGLGLLLIAPAPNLAVAFPLGFFMGTGNLLFLTFSSSLLQLESDPSMRGRVLALQSMVIIGSAPMGGPLLGFVCDTAGPRVGVLVGAVAALAAGLWGLLRVRPSTAPATSTASPDTNLAPAG